MVLRRGVDCPGQSLSRAPSERNESVEVPELGGTRAKTLHVDANVVIPQGYTGRRSIFQQNVTCQKTFGNQARHQHVQIVAKETGRPSSSRHLSCYGYFLSISFRMIAFIIAQSVVEDCRWAWLSPAD